MKNLLGTLASATLFTVMFCAPVITILAIISILVLSDTYRAITPTIPITRADDSAAWDAIFEEPDPIEEPIVLTYKELKSEIKSKYTASQRKKLGIKLNASRTVLESWL